MSEMLDRVAKRLYQIMTYRDEYAPAFENASHDEKVPAYALAKAAIEAMREPTPEMTRDLPHIDVWEQSYIHEGQAEDVYRAMIDAVLKSSSA